MKKPNHWGGWFYYLFPLAYALFVAANVAVGEWWDVVLFTLWTVIAVYFAYNWGQGRALQFVNVHKEGTAEYTPLDNKLTVTVSQPGTYVMDLDEEGK